MHFPCKNFILLIALFISLTLLNSAANGQQAGKIKIEVKNANLYLNEKEIIFPLPKSDLFELLGRPSRSVDKMNRIFTWDNLGLLAYQKPDSDAVYQVSVILNVAEMKLDFSPKNVFAGSLMIDGAPINSDSSNSGVNKLKSGRKFQSAPMAPFISDLKTGDLSIVISRALKGDFNASGKIVEVAIAKLDL